MHWVHLTERVGQKKRWIDLNLAQAFKIDAGEDGGTNIHFLNGGAPYIVKVDESPGQVSELAKGKAASGGS